MIRLKYLAVVISSILGAILYRMGGSDKWNTKWRDIGVALVGVGLLMILDFHASYWWIYLLCFGLYFGSLTTYWKFLQKIFTKK